VDALIDRSHAILDHEERLRVLRQAEDRILADWPWLFLASIREALLVKPYVKNFEPTLLDDDAAGCTNIDWIQVEIAPGSGS
jgi:hypothetical protein